MFRSKTLKRFGIGLMGVTIAILSVVIIRGGNFSERDEVLAYIDSDVSNESKVIYLEKRYENEMGRLRILLDHSDLCSPKYVNELSTLSISMQATLDGYDALSEDVDFSLYENLQTKWSDYKVLETSFNDLYEHIEDENYQDALSSLDEIEDVRSKVYFGIDDEISKVK